MSKNYDKLLEIFNEDNLGILDVKSEKSKVITEDDRLVDSFKEINDFYKENNREPMRSTDIIESKLFFRLSNIRQDQSKCKVLSKYDEFRLLKEDGYIEVSSINDIFNNDNLSILDDEEDSIFNIRNIPKKINKPEYVASREVCKDFELFESIFKNCHLDIKEGKRQLKPFTNGQQIEKGQFFILKGVLLYIDDVGDITIENGVKNARLRCIFENGTESDMLLRSLGASLYKDGRRVTESNTNMENDILEKFNNITDEDNETGYIYILKSKTKDKKIKSIPNLYKIGFSTTPVEERIKNAEHEPTYLMSKVVIVETYKCYNINVNKFESLLHNFFAESCLDIEVFDKNKNVHKPREWFIAPLYIIEQVINLILNGQIINYKYNCNEQRIVYK